jgi:hypothetical protein
VIFYCVVEDKGWLNFAMSGSSIWGRPRASSVMTEYYLMRELQTRYLSNAIVKIEYGNKNTNFTDLTGALNQGIHRSENL